ncbi:serine/threonine-protein kinase, partial [Nocardia lijiangensis]|uniref:serine/threonine-protein kinase n=1 Tax=Nocardia lijiangensis TaxID=299618 RepID=UPI001FDFBEE8
MFDHAKGTDCAMQPLGTNDPRRIGDYRLLGVLGSGGMGRVYLGRNTGGRTVAVKVIRPDLVGGDEFRARFRREVAAARRVGGRCTAPVLDADVDADPPWLATGYVAGFPLSEAVERFGTFAEATLLVLARGLAEALVAVHEAGVVHRDLKPSNVLLAVDGPKVIDFGIARAVEDTALTTTGKVIGSPGFMCPEQVTGEPVGPASDVFALGGVLAFAAAGHGPFGVGDTMRMLWRIVYEDPHLDAVPDRVRPLVASCLAKDPAARPTPRRLLDDLAALGVPERAGWLPPPVLEEVSLRAVQLLDLDSGPVEHPETPASQSPRQQNPRPDAAQWQHPETPASQSLRQQNPRPDAGQWQPPETPANQSLRQQNPRPDAAQWQHPETPANQSLRQQNPRPDAAQWQRPEAPVTPAPWQQGASVPNRTHWEQAESGPNPPWQGPDSARNAASQHAGTASAGARVRGSRPGPLLAGLLVVCVVVAVGAFVIGTQLRGGSGGDTGGGGASAS